MATLDDKLMGEKLQYYCSSSEDEDGEVPKIQSPEENVVPLRNNQANTGPKGVIEDWRRFKQLETEKREEQEKEKLALAKKLALTCRSEREDQKVQDELDKLEIEDEDDEFLKEYMKKRMQEMVEASIMNRKHFGRVYILEDGEAFLETVDHPDHSNVVIVIYIWEPKSEGCKAIDGCLQTIAKEYNHIKFCKIQVSIYYIN